MKKSTLYFLVLLILAFIPLLIPAAQAQPPIIDKDGDGVPDQLTEENLQNITNRTATRIDYLSREWKKILLKNKVVSSIDAFFRKNNVAFLILFGQSYDLTLPMLFLLMLWLIFLFKSAETLKKSMGLSRMYSFLAGFGIAIIFSQIGLLRLIVRGLVSFMSTEEGKTLYNILIAGAIFLLFLAFYFIWSFINTKLEALLKKRAERKAKENQKQLEEVTKGIKEGKKQGKSYADDDVASIAERF